MKSAAISVEERVETWVVPMDASVAVRVAETVRGMSDILLLSPAAPEWASTSKNARFPMRRQGLGARSGGIDKMEIRAENTPPAAAKAAQIAASGIGDNEKRIARAF